MNKSHFIGLRAVLVVLVGCLSLSGQLTAAVCYVDLNSTNPVPPFTDWSTAATTIQAAVDEATSGDTVRIAAGVYDGQVSISLKTNLALAGEPGTVIRAVMGMSSMPAYSATLYPVLGLWRSDVAVSGISFDGDRLGASYGLMQLVGIYFSASGGMVTNCGFRRFCGPAFADSTQSMGLHSLNPVDSGSPPVRISALRCNFEDTEIPILLRGDPGYSPLEVRATVAIKGNIIKGLGPLSGWSIGIWIVCGVAGEVSGNTVSDFASTEAWYSTGIGAYDAAAGRSKRLPLQPLILEGNTLTNNSHHLWVVGGNDCRVMNNKFLGIGPNPLPMGGVALNGTNVVVLNNNLSDMSVGIGLMGVRLNPAGGMTEPSLNMQVANNWFCNVPEPIRIDGTNVNGVQEQGTETCPFKPQFQSITKTSTGEVRTLLRGWHGESVTLEASTNFVDWVPVHTHVMELPLHECHDTNEDGAPQRFYRAVKP